MKTLFTSFCLFALLSTYAQNPPTAQEIRYYISKSVRDLNIKPEPVAEVKNEIIVTGKDSIPVRIYYPSADKKLPVIYLVHGGAIIAGDLETHDNICRYMANHIHAVVVAVHYRRPPEFKFPAAFNDSYNVLKWINNNMKMLNGNKQLVLMGDSAGGQLVAAMSLVNSNEKKPVPIMAQVLVNPALDLTKGSVTYKTYSWAVNWYLNESDNPSDVRISPLLAKDLKKVPPTIILVAEKDEIRNDGEIFHKKLLDAGVNSKIYMQPDTGHLAEFFCAAHPDAMPSITYIVAEVKKIVSSKK